MLPWALGTPSLTAGAWTVLRDQRRYPDQLVPLALKELVLLGSLQLGPVPPQGRFASRSPHLDVTDVSSAVRELHVLWTAVRRKTPTGGRVDQVVQRVGTTVGNHVVTLTVQRLIDLELMARQPVTVLGMQVRPQLRRTAAGEAAWQHFRRAVQAVTPSTSPTVLLLAAPGQAGSIDKALWSHGMEDTGFATFDSSGCFDGSGDACRDGDGDGDGGDGGNGGGSDGGGEGH